jgi:hypothetical protein
MVQIVVIVIGGVKVVAAHHAAAAAVHGFHLTANELGGAGLAVGGPWAPDVYEAAKAKLTPRERAIAARL